MSTFPEIQNNQTNNQTYNPWNYKPWWCQPWSIILTGIILISGSWLIFNNIFHLPWLTIIVAIPVLTWMVFFVIIWPKLIIRSVKSTIITGV